MLGKRSEELISHIKTHSDRISIKTTSVEYDVFIKDKDIIEIIAFNVLQIGELVKHLPSDFTKAHHEIPWKGIAGMRDRIAHGYETIDVNYLWSFAKVDVPELLNFCDTILCKARDENKVVEIVDNSKEK